MLQLLMSTGVIGISLALAVFITFVALRETRKSYVTATSMVIQDFSIRPDATGEANIHIVGRHKGVISWLLVLLGVQDKVELTVTDKDWTLRRGSLSGMVTIYYPLKNLTSSICGFQRSGIALFFSILFGLISIGKLLVAFPVLVSALGAHNEGELEGIATNLSAIFADTVLWMILWAIAFLFFYLSKRVKFAVDAGGGNDGILFKRSVIENKVIDIELAEQATALMNRLFAAAVYDLPPSQIPTKPVSRSQDGKSNALWMFVGAAAVNIALILLALVLHWYGKGVAVTVATAPPGAAIFMDDRFVGSSTKDQGPIILEHTTREGHTFSAQLNGYEPIKQTVRVGGLESNHSVTLQLTPLKYALTVYTGPTAAQVTLDGKDTGISDSSTGKLVIPNVEHGSHQIVVSKGGFRTDTRSIEIYSGARTIRIDLVNEAQAAQQESQARQQEVTIHIDRARLLFRQGQYQQALDECDNALKVDPSNAAANSLRNQIQQTRKILGQ